MSIFSKCFHVHACAGVLTKQEGTQLLSALPQPQLIAITEAMEPAARAEAENTLMPVIKGATPRGRRSTIRRCASAISPDTVRLTQIFASTPSPSWTLPRRFECVRGLTRVALRDARHRFPRQAAHITGEPHSFISDAEDCGPWCRLSRACAFEMGVTG